PPTSRPRPTSTHHTTTLPLHDALPISSSSSTPNVCCHRLHSSAGSASPAEVASRKHDRSCSDAAGWLTIWLIMVGTLMRIVGRKDRKSTRLNSSHVAISYAVFCLKKKK